MALLHGLFELGVTKLALGRQDLEPLYQEFWEGEYPRMGEMKEYRGFVDWLRLRETKEEEIILVKAKNDFLMEKPFEIDSGTPGTLKQWLSKERSVNWRPRKTAIDPEYIDMNPESVVFYSDLPFALFEVETTNDLEEILSILL